ncbi:MAG: hypothetical protein ACR2M1_11840 [Gemmatimonadaceae bacterium]
MLDVEPKDITISGQSNGPVTQDFTVSNTGTVVTTGSFTPSSTEPISNRSLSSTSAYIAPGSLRARSRLRYPDAKLEKRGLFLDMIIAVTCARHPARPTLITADEEDHIQIKSVFPEHRYCLPALAG